MTVIKTYCDHCGKELDPMHDYDNDNIELGATFLSTDLCKDCMRDLESLVTAYCSVFKKEDIK